MDRAERRRRVVDKLQGEAVPSEAADAREEEAEAVQREVEKTQRERRKAERRNRVEHVGSVRRSKGKGGAPWVGSDDKALQCHCGDSIGPHVLPDEWLLPLRLRRPLRPLGAGLIGLMVSLCAGSRRLFLLHRLANRDVSLRLRRLSLRRLQAALLTLLLRTRAAADRAAAACGVLCAVFGG